MNDEHRQAELGGLRRREADLRAQCDRSARDGDGQSGWWRRRLDECRRKIAAMEAAR